MKRTFLPALGMGLALAGASAWTVHSILKAQARKRAEQSLDRFQDLAETSFRQGEAFARALAARWEEGDGDFDTPKTLLALAPFLDQEGAITSLMLYDLRERILFLNRTRTGWSISAYRWTGEAPESFTASHDTYAPAPGNRFAGSYRPRERPWFRFALASQQPGWMPDAYRFPSGTCGYSFLVPLRDRTGALRAVAGADLNLNLMARKLWSGEPAFRALEVTDARGRTLVPRWSAALEASPAALAEDLLTPSPAAEASLAERSFASHGHPVLHAKVLPLQADLAWGWGAWAAVGLPPLATGLLAALFLHRRLRRQNLGPLARLAGAEGRGDRRDPEEASALRQGSRQDAEAPIQDDRATTVRLEELQQHLEQLQRTEALEAMTPGVIHDAKNQLAVAMGNLSLASEVLEEHPELSPYLDRARGATMRCGEILKALLAYSRTQTKTLESLDMNLLVRDAACLLRGALGRTIQLQVALEEALPPLRGERTKLEQIIVNLALNARDAMPEGGVFTLRTRNLGGAVQLEVEDTGIGMPADVQARIFEPFFTTKSRGQGTGLGLAMVASIVHAMHGRIHVASAPGRGTRFRLSFPIQEPPTAPGGSQGCP